MTPISSTPTKAVGSKAMPNRKPYPKCKDCKGTGKVTLFTSSGKCDCVDRNPPQHKQPDLFVSLEVMKQLEEWCLSDVGRKKMDEKQLSRILDEFIGKIEDNPGSHTDVFSQIAKRHVAMKEFKEGLSELNESLGAIRLILKYLVFDLEATRRERDQLRMLLEDQN